MKFAAISLALMASVVATPIPEETYQSLFQEFIQKFEKSYPMEEFFDRYNVFKTNLDFVREHNAKTRESYKLAMNHMGDLSGEEYSKKLGFQRANMGYLRSQNYADLSNVTAPASVDWVAKGAVTPVKNQEQCGSCWAFSTTGSVEGHNFIKNGELVSLSEQELVDCSAAEGDNGCNGGLMDYGFEYIIKEGGLCTESDYPYTASGGSCSAKSCGDKKAQITGFKDVQPEDEASLKKAVSLGPVSVAIEADKQAFQFYKSGVLTSSACGTQLDHGVLIVGYGTDSGTPYWKVKNSWGASWGQDGYILIKRATEAGSSPGECGIASQPSFPTFN